MNYLSQKYERFLMEELKKRKIIEKYKRQQEYKNKKEEKNN